VDQEAQDTVDPVLVKKKTRGLAQDPSCNQACRYALDAAEHMAAQGSHDNLPGATYGFSMKTLQLEHPAIAAQALVGFKRAYPDSKLMDHEIFNKLQKTQDSRLQVVIKKVYVIDDTVTPPITLPAAGTSVTKSSKLTLGQYRK
jgi:hypothetical protein